MKEVEYRIENYENDVVNAYDMYMRLIVPQLTYPGSSEPLADSLTEEHIREYKKIPFAIANQMLSAATKRLKAGVALRMLDEFDKQFDMTSTLANHITMRLLGRSLNRKILLDRYATENRTAKNKTQDFEKLESLAQNEIFIKYKNELESSLSLALSIRNKHKKEFYGKDSSLSKLIQICLIKKKLPSR